MTGFPKLALSVRQPWAWAIIQAWPPKDVENREWEPTNPGLRVRGRVAIHAGKGMTRFEYEDGAEFMETLGLICPPAAKLQRGGIIGTVEIVDVVTRSESRWFFGPYGFVLRDPQPCDFIPAVGALGFFEWKRDHAGIETAPAKWMLSRP